MKKSFFRKRTPEEMQRDLEMRRVNWQLGLVDKIWNLHDDQGLIVMSPLVPASFLGRSSSQATDSRRHYRWGNFLPVKQPESQSEAKDSGDYTPFIGRMYSLDSLKNMDERDVNIIGISWRPVQGRDRRLRLVPFDAVFDAINIFSYSHFVGTGIDVNKKYTEARIVREEGGQVICKVPSRTRRKEKYKVVLNHVPLIAGREENAIILSLDCNFLDNEPERDIYLHDLRYSFAQRRETSDRVVFGPHAIAAYFEVIKRSQKKLDETVPLRMNPFPILSKAAFEYGRRLDNNLLIFDKTLESKDKLRNLHLNEKCLLFGRAISQRGSWETVYWDPKRDGSLSKYRYLK